MDLVYSQEVENLATKSFPGADYLVTQVRYLVLDEVDRMMELGWEPFTARGPMDAQASSCNLMHVYSYNSNAYICKNIAYG